VLVLCEIDQETDCLSIWQNYHSCQEVYDNTLHHRVSTIIEIEEEDDACANIIDRSSGSEPESDCESSFTLSNIGLMPI